MLVFVGYAMMFAIVTPALITGAFANRVTPVRTSEQMEMTLDEPLHGPRGTHRPRRSRLEPFGIVHNQLRSNIL